MMELLIAAVILVILMTAIYSILISSWWTYMTGESKADIQQTARLGIEMMETDLRMIGYGYPTDPALINPKVKINAASATSIDFWADIKGASTTLAADVNPGNTTFSVVKAAGISAGDTIWLINGGVFDSFAVTGVNTGANPNTITVSGGGPTRLYPQGAQVGRPKRIVYTYTAGTPGSVTRDEGEGAGPQTLLDNVTAFQLQYFDGNNLAPCPLSGCSIAAPVSLANLPSIRRMTVSFTVQAPRATGPSGVQSYTTTSDVRPRNL